MKLFTIGFTKKSAETFFMRLKNAGVRRLIDVRLNNVSQLAGFTKRDDLRYFTKALCNIDYVHLPELAPTAAILDPYKKSQQQNDRADSTFDQGAVGLEIENFDLVEQALSYRSIRSGRY